MSEHACWAEAREALREVLGVEGPARQIVLANVLAAAEERGRRAGIEEGFRRGVENAAQWLKISEPLRLAMHRALSDLVDLAQPAKVQNDLRAMMQEPSIDAALAPRDSGKGTT